MKIRQRGNQQIKFPLLWECRNCGCVFEFDESDIEQLNLPWATYVVKCPDCTQVCDGAVPYEYIPSLRGR
jgi:hypothetical protein